MHRRAPLACLLAGLALSLGCASSASPWDYCGPVYNGGCNPCIVDDRVGSAFTGGPGGYAMGEGESYYDEEGAAYDEAGDAYDQPLEELPTPADDNEPLTPDEYGPPGGRDVTPPDTTSPLEPPAFDDATPPGSILPPPETDAIPPLEAPPGEGRRTSYTAPAKQARSATASGAKTSAAKTTAASSPEPPTSESAAANAPAKTSGWKASAPKKKFRR